MEHTFKELKNKTVAELKEIAKEIDHEEVHGYTQMNKDHLLEAVCKALNIEMHAHHEVVGLDKKEIKAKIRDLKKKRTKALEAKDRKRLKKVRKEIKSLKNQLRRATV
jgi:DNA-binding IclR family transcriptional regulator